MLLNLLYVTADVVGGWSGGSQVTQNEVRALRELGEVTVIDRTIMGNQFDPWGYDDFLRSVLDGYSGRKYDLAHFYAGTFTKTIEWLKRKGTKITYTADAHDIQESKQAYENLGLNFDYPHLTDSEQWKRYVGGYLQADMLICPSQHSVDVMRRYGRNGAIALIPHGVELPNTTNQRHGVLSPFTVGYLGSYGPDKGVRYLLEAWKQLNHPDDVLLLGGKDSKSPWVNHLIHTYGGGKIEQVGWLDNVSDFYNRCSLYVQPSVTEGFGIEILEACAHGVPVIASQGAGASYLVPLEYTFPAKSVQKLMYVISNIKHYITKFSDDSSWTESWYGFAKANTCKLVRDRYVDNWKILLEKDE